MTQSEALERLGKFLHPYTPADSLWASCRLKYLDLLAGNVAAISSNYLDQGRRDGIVDTATIITHATITALEVDDAS